MPNSVGWGGAEASRLLKAVLREYGIICHLCGEPIEFGLRPRHPRGPSADHLVPRDKGGSNDIRNLRPAHLGCNASRGNRLLDDSMNEDGWAFFKTEPQRDPAPALSFSPQTVRKNADNDGYPQE